MPIAFDVVTAILLGVVTQVIFYFMAHAFKSRSPFFSYLACLSVVCSILSIQALIRLPLLPAGVLCVMIFLAYKGLRRHSPISLSVGHKLVLVPLAFLLINSIYAAIPLFRYDQWNYHLVIAKLIHQMGTLPQPLISDHLGFAGGYEYFYTIVRLFVQDDTIVQSYTNISSWLFLFVPIFMWVREQIPDVARWQRLLIVMSLLFGLNVSESIMNAKPDFLFVAYALALLTLLRDLGRSNNSAWFVFFLIAPLSFKVSWVQFSACVAIVSCFYQLRRISVSEAIKGLAFALFIVVPVFLKNTLFFKNPFHPVQMIFHSNYWSSELATYWQTYMQPVHSASQYFRELPRVIFFLVTKQLAFYIIGVVALALIAYKQNKSLKNTFEAQYAWIVALFTLLWPIFYHAEIDARFIAPIFSVGFLCFVELLKTTSFSPLVYLILTLPFAISSNIEVKIKTIARNLFLHRDEFYQKFPPSLQHPLVYAKLNQHRSQFYPNAAFDEHTVLADTAGRYFLDSQLIFANSYEYEILLNDFRLTERALLCPWAVISAFKINYLVSINDDISKWPSSMQTIARFFEPIDNDKKIFYLSDDRINELKNSWPGCQN